MLLCFGVVCEVVPVAVFATLTLLVLVAASRHRKPIQQLLVISAVLGMLLVVVRVHAITNDAVELVITNPLSRNITFSIQDDPRLQASRGFGALSFDKEVGVVVDVRTVDQNSISFPAYLSAVKFEESFQHAEISSTWSCRGRFRESIGIRRTVAFVTCVDTPVLNSRATHQQHIASVVRNALQVMTSERHPDDDGAALLPGLVVGDTSAQSSELENDLRSSGLGHLTAVSGANVAIVIAACEVALRRTRFRRPVRILLLAFAVLSFVVIARPSPSVVRAAAMALLTLWVWFRGSQRHSEIVVFLSCAALLVFDPWLAASWGFGLSVAATLGLIVLPRMWGVSAQSSFAIRAVSTALAAGLATLPLLIAMGSAPTFASIPANVMAELFVAPATIAGVVTAVVAALASVPLVGEIAAPVIHVLAIIPAEIGIWCARAIVIIARLANQSVFNIVVISSAGLLFALLVIALLYLARRRSVLNSHMALVIVLIASVVLWCSRSISQWTSNWPPPQWEVVACDVGQGDATVVRLANHSAMVIDVGGDPALLDRCLDDLAVETIELFIASHFHADHVGGVAGLARGRSVKRVVIGINSIPRGGLELVQETFPHLTLENAVTGMTQSYRGEFGEVTWSVLQISDGSVMEDDGTSINNQSVVVLISTPHFSVLLTGDIEISAQTTLMKAIAPLHVNVVKVPHHGSRSQVPTFAQWTGGSLAWISVGADNDYGHPSREAITYYKQAGMVILTTADCGDIAVLKQEMLGFAPRDECRSV
ncbi:MAG: hypothetical protein RIS75_295 [Actinomycetota bacterium]